MRFGSVALDIVTYRPRVAGWGSVRFHALVYDGIRGSPDGVSVPSPDTRVPHRPITKHLQQKTSDRKPRRRRCVKSYKAAAL